jgi:hypothetical protein
MLLCPCVGVSPLLVRVRAFAGPGHIDRDPDDARLKRGELLEALGAEVNDLAVDGRMLETVVPAGVL